MDIHEFSNKFSPVFFCPVFSYFGISFLCQWLKIIKYVTHSLPLIFIVITFCFSWLHRQWLSFFTYQLLTYFIYAYLRIFLVIGTNIDGKNILHITHKFSIVFGRNTPLLLLPGFQFVFLTSFSLSHNLHHLYTPILPSFWSVTLMSTSLALLVLHYRLMQPDALPSPHRFLAHDIRFLHDGIMQLLLLPLQIVFLHVQSLRHLLLILHLSVHLSTLDHLHFHLLLGESAHASICVLNSSLLISNLVTLRVPAHLISQYTSS